MVDVGYEDQKSRYVFSELNEDFIQLSTFIDEPRVFLKVCAAAGEVEQVVPGKWTIQPQAYMMSCFHPMNIADSNLQEEYRLEFDNYNSTFVVRILTREGVLASGGRVVLVNDLAVYDRIETDSQHRRKGLAGFLMKELEKIALSNGVFKNFLVATEEGRSLYQSLGWEIYSLYTSIVMPG